MKALLLFLLALCAPAFGQGIQTQMFPSTLASSTALDVQRLAPQLVAFAGGDANFQSLVGGLAAGSQVTLTTLLPTGGTQVVTFTPAQSMTALQIAQTLESVRQSLIARGIATPTGQQLAIALTGGSLTTPAGTAAVNGVLATTGTTAQQQQSQQSPAVSIQNTFSAAAAGGSTTLRSQTSDSRYPRGISDTPPNVGQIPQTPAPVRIR